MTVVGIGEEEDGLFKVGDLVVHLVRFDMRLELGKVVDSALSVGGGDDMVGVLPDVLCDFAPGSFYSLDRVSECAVLINDTRGVRFGNHDKESTHHVEEDSVGVEGGRHDWL